MQNTRQEQAGKWATSPADLARWTDRIDRWSDWTRPTAAEYRERTAAKLALAADA